MAIHWSGNYDYHMEKMEPEVHSKVCTSQDSQKEQAVGENIAYITVGSGIGIGLVVNKSTVYGLVHPEGGHIKVPKLSYDKDFKGVCPYHRDCLNGMVTNKSIAARLKCSIKDLADVSDNDPVWFAVGHYLAHACLNLTLIGCPEKIVIDDGVMNRDIILFTITRQQFAKLLNQFLQHPKIQAFSKQWTYVSYVVGPGIWKVRIKFIDKYYNFIQNIQMNNIQDKLLVNLNNMQQRQWGIGNKSDY